MARFGRGVRAETAEAALAPRDVEALEQVMLALDSGVTSVQDSRIKIVNALVGALGLAYGALWVRAGAGDFGLAVESGDLLPVMAKAAGGARQLPADAGLIGIAVSTRRPVLVSDAPETGRSCLRWQAAHRAGMLEAATVPIVENGAVIAVLEFFGRAPLPQFANEKWSAITRIALLARNQALATAALKETSDDRAAVTTVVSRVGAAPSEDTAIRVALDSVRTAFGWAYGSFWAHDPEHSVLRFSAESGSAGEEFRAVTLAASFAEGVGLSGRAWRTRGLVFVRDLAEVTDCVRAPAAQRAGVRSGVCFPILDGTTVLGTMDFFTTESIELSESRTAALRNVQQLVSQRLAVLRREEKGAERARRLLDSVTRLREAAHDAGRVADRAVSGSEAMTGEVTALGQASSAVGDVIKIINGIAEQTNLLALNATIEAARAGDVGRGFAVVANEVKDLARETAEATSRVSAQIAGIQASSQSVAAGIHATSQTIGQLDSVQARINEILEEQARLAAALESSDC